MPAINNENTTVNAVNFIFQFSSLIPIDRKFTALVGTKRYNAAKKCLINSFVLFLLYHYWTTPVQCDSV